MADIFDNPYSKTQVLYASGCTVQWAKDGDKTYQSVDLVMLGIRATYSRRGTPIFPINNDKNGKGIKYMVMGSPQGQASIQSIYAPTGKALKEFMDALTGTASGSSSSESSVSKSCTAVTLKLTPFAGANCTLGVSGSSSGSASNVAYNSITLTGVTMNSMDFGISAGEAAMVSLNLGLDFTGMSVDFTGSEKSDK